MTVATILELARMLTNTSTGMTNLADADLLKLLNVVYHDIAWSIRTEIGEDYFVKEFTANTVADQERYAIREATSTQQGWGSILEIGIKWDNEQEFYNKLQKRKSTSDNVMADEDKAKRSESQGIFDVMGKYIYIYPSPTTSVSNWLKVFATTTLVDLLVDSVDADIFPDNTELRDHHELLVLWLKKWIYEIKGQTNESVNAMNAYNVAKMEAIRQLKYREGRILQTHIPEAW